MCPPPCPDPACPDPACPDDGARLRLPDRLLLWAMRAWVIGFNRRIDVVAPTRAAFAKYRMAPATELVDALMSVVACGATRTLAVECVCHRGLSVDEKHLLAAATLRQAGPGIEAIFLLRTMLTAPACRDAAEILDRLGVVYAAAGFTLSSLPTTTERLVFDADRARSAGARLRIH